MEKIERQFCQWHETMETRAECSMKSTTEKWTHTKTPWKVADQKEYIYANNRTSVAKTLTIDCPFMEAAANSAFIVRAVNSHEAAFELAAKALAVLPQIANPLIRKALENAAHEFYAKAEGRI